MLSPLPSSREAPSIWYAEVAAPQRKPRGKIALVIRFSATLQRRETSAKVRDSDDGRGSEPASELGFGLLGVRERASAPQKARARPGFGRSCRFPVTSDRPRSPHP